MESLDNASQDGKEPENRALPSKKSKLKGFVFGGVALGLLAVGGVVFVSMAPTKLESAVESCSLERNLYLTLDSDGKGLYLDGDGDENPGMNISEIVCVLSYLEVPNSILSRMDNTTALMGQQIGSWDGISVLWSYHPSNGLDISLDLD